MADEVKLPELDGAGWTGKKCPVCKGAGDDCAACGGTGDEYSNEHCRKMQLLAALEREQALRGLIYNFSFWAKRLLEEEDAAQNCGDHCRNSCRWCGLRNSVEDIGGQDGR
jgi:hypothetical protein